MAATEGVCVWGWARLTCRVRSSEMREMLILWRPMAGVWVCRGAGWAVVALGAAGKETASPSSANGNEGNGTEKEKKEKARKKHTNKNGHKTGGRKKEKKKREKKGTTASIPVPTATQALLGFNETQQDLDGWSHLFHCLEGQKNLFDCETRVRKKRRKKRGEKRNVFQAAKGTGHSFTHEGPCACRGGDGSPRGAWPRPPGPGRA